MHRQSPVSSTYEMYLKVLYEVRDRHDVARVRDVAKGLGVSPGAVSGALKKLEQAGYVEHERYGFVSLTRAGLAIAVCMRRRHQTIRDVLVEIFGVDPETAAADACLMEHAASPATINRMTATLALVRAAKLELPLVPAENVSELCAECEAAGYCQAEADAS